MDTQKEKKKTGRKSNFTPELIEEILKRISNGESERGIFEDKDMPSWIAWTALKRRECEKKDSVFLNQYARSKEDCWEVWEYRLEKIADDESRDQVPDGKGGFKSDNTACMRDRLRIDTRKWIMSKLASKKYGDKLQTELTGKDGGAIQYERLVDRPPVETPEQWQERVSKQLADRQKNLTH